jgi:hypothetical protein
MKSRHPRARVRFDVFALALLVLSTIEGATWHVREVKASGSRGEHDVSRRRTLR